MSVYTDEEIIMSNTRQTKTREEKTLLDDIVEAGIITGGLVVPYAVLGFLLQNAQTRTNNNLSSPKMPQFNKFSVAGMTATAVTMKKTLPYLGWCAQRGMLRNTTYLQQRRWEPQKSEKSEKVEGVIENPSLEADLMSDLAATSGIAAVISGSNVVLMLRSKNYSVWYAHQLTHPDFPIPRPTTLHGQFKVSMTGATATWAGDFAFLFGLMAVPYLKSSLNRLFPDYPRVAECGALATCAGITSFFSNWFGGILYNNQLIRFNSQTMSAPRLSKVASDLLATEASFLKKIKVLTYGFNLQLVTTGFTLFALPKMQVIAGNTAPWIISSIASLCGMFSRRNSAQPKEPDVSNSKEQQRNNENEALRGCSP